MKVLYAHFIFGVNHPFYIGYGNAQRPFDTKSRTRYWHNHVKAHGKKYWVGIIESGLSAEHAKILEVLYIEKYKPKCNFTKGGDGVVSLTPEAKQRHAEAVRDAWNKPGAKEKRSAQMKVVMNIPAVKVRNMTALRIANNKPETRVRRSEAKKKYFANVSNRINQSKLRSAYLATPEGRRLQSEIVKRAWIKRKLNKIQGIEAPNPAF